MEKSMLLDLGVILTRSASSKLDAEHFEVLAELWGCGHRSDPGRRSSVGRGVVPDGRTGLPGRPRQDQPKCSGSENTSCPRASAGRTQRRAAREIICSLINLIKNVKKIIKKKKKRHPKDPESRWFCVGIWCPQQLPGCRGADPLCHLPGGLWNSREQLKNKYTNKTKQSKTKKRKKMKLKSSTSNTVS